MRPLLLAVLLLPLLASCGDPPAVGFWESDKKLSNGKRNKLELVDDYTGTAKIYATPVGDPATWIKFEFKVLWADETDSFKLDLNCDEGPCDGKHDDFDMECEVIEENGAEYMDCKGDRKWADYPFQWQRDI